MSELMMAVEFAQPPDRIFEAFEDPFQTRRWYGAPAGCQRVTADDSPQLGETFRVHLIDARGAPFAQVGRILSVEPAKSLEMEMSWEGRDFGQETTRVSMTFHPLGSGTRLEVRQGPFSTPEELEVHREYWETCLGRLARVASGEAMPCFEEFWEESQGFTGPLGAAAYAVLAGMREAGAAPEVIAQVEDALYTHLARLPEDTAGVLGSVLRARVR
ncbi:MAG TPA: SRPBCC domain-containing protein [Hyalangium sp.]|nr:SRPBCC domain-containing protein [Hyalangium sp.]